MVIIELFYSPLCTYCSQARSVIEDILSELGDEIPLKVEEYDIFSDAGMEKKIVYNIKDVPTLIINGRIKITGAPKKDWLRQILKKESGSAANRWLC